MKRKRKQPKTDEELDIEIGLADAVEDGDVALAGTSADGEPQFALTDKGKRTAEALLRKHGVDPNDKGRRGALPVWKGAEEMMDPIDFAKRAVGIHDKIAADLPQGGIMRCSTCGREEPIRDGDVARYLARGWPKCHGTMEWITTSAEKAKR